MVAQCYIVFDPNHPAKRPVVTQSLLTISMIKQIEKETVNKLLRTLFNDSAVYLMTSSLSHL